MTVPLWWHGFTLEDLGILKLSLDFSGSGYCLRLTIAVFLCFTKSLLTFQQVFPCPLAAAVQFLLLLTGEPHCCKQRSNVWRLKEKQTVGKKACGMVMSHKAKHLLNQSLQLYTSDIFAKVIKKRYIPSK